MKISLCMIVRNEEKTIGRCLECVQDICDEIIVVDTGSTDQTKKIASQYTQNIYDFNWIDDFSKARNFAFSKASQDYIMWLDADDIIDDENIEKIKVLKRSLKEDIDVVMMQYQMGKESDYVFSRERLVKRKNNYQWVGAVHEYIEITGKIMYSDIKIIHQKKKVTNSHRNIRIYEKMIKEGKTLNTRELFYYARELMEHHQYDKAIVYFEKFLIQKDGWKENKIEACLDLSYCYREMNNSHKALQILLYSFLFDNPRSEIMCQIGLIFMSLEQYEQAIYWYLKALENQRDENSGAFVQKSCYDFIPYIQLCVCYDRLGNHELAYQYNELAGKLKPNDPSYLFNQAYFSKILDLKRP